MLSRVAASLGAGGGVGCSIRAPTVRRPLYAGLRARLMSTATATSQPKAGLMDEAEVVIIGGGAVGCSVAYHLAKRGCQGVILLEMSELTAGSTWHAAGLVTSFHPAANIKPVHQYSLDLYSQLEKETGQAINFHTPGSIRFATTDLRAEELRYQVSRCAVGNPMRLLTPEQIQQYCPLIDTKQIKLGLHTHSDGHLDPYSLTQALAKGAKNYGAKIVQNVRVEGLSERPGGGWQIDTINGTINTTHVVNAAGFYAKHVGSLSGIDLPLVAVEHQYIVMPKIPEIQRLQKEIPVLRYMEASSYIRQERGGLLIGVYEAGNHMKLRDDWAINQVPEDFSKQLFEEDLERSESYLSQVMDIFPSVKDAQIQSIVNGPITYSPDGLPLVGPHLKKGMWLSVGHGFGIIQCGGLGKYLAEYIMAGEPQQPMIELEPGRFQPHWATPDFQLAKVRETYGLSNSPGYPYEERTAGRPSARVTPAIERQRMRGASFLPHAGWEQPAWFAEAGCKPEYKPAFERSNWHTAALREYNHVMNSVGVIDLSPFGKFFLEGIDAPELLRRITANAVPREGRCAVTHVLTSRGTILAEWTVSQVKAGKFMIVTGSGSEIHDLRWVKHKSQEWGLSDVSITNVTDELACLSLAGPKAHDVLQRVSEESPDLFPYFSTKEVTIADVPVTAIRLSYTGELGFELYHPMNLCDKLYSAILAVENEFDIKDFGTHALNLLRLEKGFRGWGAEMTVNNNMMEAGMMDFVHWKKGDFEGRAALIETMKRNPERLLVQVAFDSPKLDPMGDENVYAFGKKVGYTTSGGYSPKLQKTLAFCYLPPLLTIPGSVVQVEILNELLEATVLAAPPMLTHFARTMKKKK